MISVSGYKNLKIIHQSAVTVVYTATRESDGDKVVMRQLRPEVATPKLANQYQHEFELLKSLDSQHIVRAVDLLQHNGCPILVTEHIPGETLSKIVGDKPMDLHLTLKLSQMIAATLKYLHSKRIIYRDLNPNNIIYNQASQSLKIIDFEISTSETTIESEPNFTIEGSLPYLSPEQTGRLSRAIDYRTDFYSFGATLYHLLTGHPPFLGDDILELVHSHIARTAPSPDTINPLVPKALAKITMKLLAKDPADRYQNVHTIEQDLQQCIELVSSSSLDAAQQDFTVALDDFADQLIISETLLGRSEAIDEINLSYQSAAVGNMEIVALVGDTGAGKTSLLHHFESEVVEQGGFIARGRFNQMTAGTPYLALSTAIDDLIRQLMLRSDFYQLREKIRQVLEGFESPMLGIIPGLNRVIEPAAEIRLLSPTETQNKLIHGISALLKTVCHDGQPFVLCLDNTHWIDLATLNLLEPMISESLLSHVMIICAYRTSELEAQHETRLAVNKLITHSPAIKVLRLANLDSIQIAEMLSQCLFRPTVETAALADIIYAKTAGNPLATKEFLRSIESRHYLYFEHKHQEWLWDLPSISNMPPTESVGEGLANQLRQVDQETLDLLQIASCIGYEFDLHTLKLAAGVPLTEVTQRIADATTNGFVLAQETAADNISVSIFKFAHERIQQTAYSLLDLKRKRSIHRNIGQILLDSGRGEQNIFNVVNQLNNSFGSVDMIGINRNKLAELNYSAGKKARDSAAFQAAFKYFKTAIALFGQNLWANYELSFQLHLDTAEAAQLCLDQRQLEILANNTLHHARTPLDKAKMMEIQVQGLINSNRLDDALQTGHKALQMLSVNTPSKGTLIGIVLMCKLLLKTSRITKQVELNKERMQQENLLAAMRMLMIMCRAAYMSGNPATVLYILKMTELSVKHGMAPESSFAYPMFGSILISYLGNIDAGYQFGKLALANLDDTNRELHCKTITLVNNFIFSWKQHLKTTLEPLAQAQQVGMETGDTEFATIAAVTSSANSFVLGQDLNSLEASLSAQNNKAIEFNQTLTYELGAIYQQATSNLTHKVRKPWLLEGEVFQESQLIQRHELKSTSIANLYILKMFIAILFGEHLLAMQYASEARKSLEAVISSPAVTFFVIYESLACIAALHHCNYFEKAKLRVRLKLNIRLLRKWSHHSPANVIHGYHLIEAERSKLYGDVLNAMSHYDKAIEAAKKYGFVKEQALANENAGRFYLAQSKRELGIFYLGRAKNLYQRWGAPNKVQCLIEEFSELDEIETNIDNTHYPFQPSGNSLDLGSVIKASQVLSGEIMLDSLLERLMLVALENAGAHSASLILNQDEQLNLNIRTSLNGISIEHQRYKTPINETNNLPLSMIQYVARTEEDLVLNDVLNEDIFSQDEYLLKHQPKAILCLPILSKSHLTGILYIENLQLTHAFSQERVSILKLLASQSAIAIENAKLYEQLNKSRDRYLSLYRNAIEGMFEIDKDGLLLNINPAAAKLLGYDSPEEVLAADHQALGSSFVNQADFKTLQTELLSRGRVIGFETKLRRKDNSEIWVSFSLQLIFNEDNNETQLEGSITDISERRRRVTAEQARIVAESAATTKSDFLATMSHEIRTPMNAIIGYTDLAIDTDLDTQQRAYLETIKNSSNQLLRVINDILDISKVESGKLELKQSPFKLATVLNDLKSLLQLDAADKGLNLNIVEVDTDLVYIGDGLRISQILINLVGNAIKFTEFGEINVAVDINNTDAEYSYLSFTITDSGIGIDESHLETIFESFTQASVTPNDSGTGLGLAICKKLVEMMDGEIYATSEPEVGSTFHFSIHLRRQQTNEPAIIEPLELQPAAESLAGKPVLLVEDNPISQNLASEVLGRAGVDVSVANNGVEALELLGNNRYFAVLMDIQMPVMDGIEAIKRIRADDHTSNITVIAMSAGVLESEISEAMQAGFDHYLSKPVNFQSLLALLNELTGASTEVHSKPESPEVNIRGVDFSQALHNHDNDMSLLINLTAAFVDLYSQADADISEFLDNNNLDKAERLAHNIAGVAGSFGANKLMDSARTLEHAILGSQGDLKSLLIAFSQELSNFTQAIEILQLEYAA